VFVGEYFDKSMYLKFVGKVVVITYPQESTKTWPKSMKNYELLPLNLERPPLLLTFFKKKKKR
jgi:hypothetical protein